MGQWKHQQWEDCEEQEDDTAHMLFEQWEDQLREAYAGYVEEERWEQWVMEQDHFSAYVEPEQLDSGTRNAVLGAGELNSGVRSAFPDGDLGSTSHRSTAQSKRLLTFGFALLPKKITNEALGDEWELIDRRDKKGMNHRLNQLHTLSALFWAVMFSLKEFIKPSALIAAVWKLLG